MRHRTAAAAALLALSGPAHAQSPPPADTSAWVLEAGSPLEDAAEEMADGESAVRDLEALRERPVDVNSASVEELAAVPGISAALAAAVVAHRARHGPFPSVDALHEVPGITRRTVGRARQYLIAVARDRHPSRRASDGRRRVRISLTSRLQRRLETARGYVGTDSTRTYRGSPLRALTRVQARSSRHLLASLTLEKDAGEAFGDNRLGFDHLSGTVAYTGSGRVRALLAGDFIAEFGQGLALGRAGAMGKSADATGAPARAGRGLRAFASGSEGRFLRGAGATVAPLPRVSISAFASRRRLDATLETSDGPATSVGGGGLHRTRAELARRGLLEETVAGGAVEVHVGAGRSAARIGVAGYAALFGLPVAPPRSANAPSPSNGAGVLSLSAEGRRDGYHAFGEVARAGSATALLAGAGAAAAPGLEVLLVARRYPADFSSPLGAAFGERAGAANNEQGLYAGARAERGAWSLHGFVDAYRFPWLRRGVPRPSAGREALVRLAFEPRGWVRLHAQVRAESREEGAASAAQGGSAVGALTRSARRTSRLHAELDASRSLRLRVRLETSRAVAADTSHSGVLLLQDIRWAAGRRLRLDARLVLFEAGDFSARVYQLETDVSGSFTLPALHGRGARTYVMATVGPYRGLTVQFKIAGTFHEDTIRLGSGPDAVDGNRSSEATLQASWRF